MTNPSEAGGGFDKEQRAATEALWDASGRSGALRDFTVDVKAADGELYPMPVRLEGSGEVESLRFLIDGSWRKAEKIERAGAWSWRIRAGGCTIKVDGADVTIS